MENQVIIIESIRDNAGQTKKDGTPYKENTSGLMVSTTFSRGAGSGVIAKFFGGRDSKKVAFITADNKVLEGWKAQQGMDLNSLPAFKDAPLALELRELTASQYNALSATEKLGFTAKVNPETKAPVTHKGEQVYFKTELVLASECNDIILENDVVAKVQLQA